MFTKVLLISALVAVAYSATIEYPAGIHPAVCPNFPYCDAEVLARHTPSGIPIPEWELPYARMAPAPIPIVAGQYPADVDPALCPNYPFCA